MAQRGEEVFSFKFPTSIVPLAGGHASIGIRQVKSGTSLELLRQFPDDSAGYVKAKVVRAIATLDGQPVSYTDAQTFYEGLPAKVADLIDRAYQSVNLPSEEDVKDFLSSVEVTGG